MIRELVEKESYQVQSSKISKRLFTNRPKKLGSTRRRSLKTISKKRTVSPIQSRAAGGC